MTKLDILRGPDADDMFSCLKGPDKTTTFLIAFPEGPRNCSFDINTIAADDKFQESWELILFYVGEDKVLPRGERIRAQYHSRHSRISHGSGFLHVEDIWL